ncbi:MAG: copper oxidase [Planctomycetes bacterium]|nr:copper oxidase [Planctomycetota bacterium]
MTTRRVFLQGSALAGVAGALRQAQAFAPAATFVGPAAAPGLPGEDYLPVVTPNGVTLPFRVVDGCKVFHLVAEPVTHTFAEGLVAECWGYNGRVHGPTIEAVVGDAVRIYVTNRLPAPTTVHWHGLAVPNGMDGVGGLTQRSIEPGETFKYEFVLRQSGTFMYHPHHDEMTQMAMGLMGMFVVHPRKAPPQSGPGAEAHAGGGPGPVDDDPPVQRDYAFLLSEWKLTPGMRRPDPTEMTDFNVLTLNATAFPSTEAMVAKTGERVRIRIGNLSSMDHHPIHLHGVPFQVVETDGGRIPRSARWPEVTVLVPTGSTRTIELVARDPGDWAMHCHMTHHIMNQMGHGLPNLIGVDPSQFDYALEHAVPGFSSMGEHDGPDEDTTVPKNSIAMLGGSGPFGFVTMGGMVTTLKVRDTLVEGQDPGWYEHPPGTVADVASDADLERDGIDPRGA